MHPNDRKRVVRALELWQAGATLVPAEPRLWTAETRVPTCVVGLEVSPETLAARIRTRAEAMFEPGRGGGGARRRGRVERAQVLGLESRPDAAARAGDRGARARDRRFAAYQRKWMRRIPGIVMIDAERPAAEVADAILEVARAR